MHERKEAQTKTCQLSAEIDKLKKKLDLLIDRGADYSKIYDASIKLDVLIVRYYSEHGNTGDNK